MPSLPHRNMREREIQSQKEDEGREREKFNYTKAKPSFFCMYRYDKRTKTERGKRLVFVALLVETFPAQQLVSLIAPVHAALRPD